MHTIVTPVVFKMDHMYYSEINHTTIAVFYITLDKAEILKYDIGHTIKASTLIRTDIICTLRMVLAAGIRALRRYTAGKKGVARDLGIEVLRCLVGTRQITVAKEFTKPNPEDYAVCCLFTAKDDFPVSAKYIKRYIHIMEPEDTCPYISNTHRRDSKGYHPCIKCNRNVAEIWSFDIKSLKLTPERSVEDFLIEKGALVELE